MVLTAVHWARQRLPDRQISRALGWKMIQQPEQGLAAACSLSQAGVELPKSLLDNNGRLFYMRICFSKRYDCEGGQCCFPEALAFAGQTDIDITDVPC
jgi:hypothetical protein